MSQAARALVIGGVVAAAAASAHARPQGTYVKIKRPAMANPTPAGVTSSKIVFVKRCTTDCIVHFDPVDDARTGASSIAADTGPRQIGPFTQSTEVWNEMMACVRETFAPFDITITDVRPSDQAAPRFMNMVGGKPGELHPSYTGAGGVAPFDCGEIPNAITYTFDVYGPDPLALCWTVSQEVAHAFGLEHEFLQKDPMTYLSGDVPKRFRDVDAPCGELEVSTDCACRPNAEPQVQNSYRHIVGMFGPGAPTPPAVEVKNPVEGKPTQPGFTAVAIAIDEVRVERVEAYIDGTLVSTSMTPYGDTFELPTEDVGAGPHELEIKAFDVQGVVNSVTVPFTQGPPCTPSTVCTGKDVCVAGVCIPGPEVPGGLGAVCSTDNECLSHRCADAGEQFKHCVDSCNVANGNSCPDDFECIPAGDEGVCWPAPGGGCCDAGTGPQGPIALTLGLGLLLLRRRRAKVSVVHQER